MPSSVNKLYSWDTEYSADSAEFCPIDPFKKYLAVGTYQLADNEEKGGDSQSQNEETCAPKQRLGRLYLKHINEDKTLKLVQKIEMKAILDMKWCQHKLSGNAILAIANASGQVLLYKLEQADGEFMQLILWCIYEIDEESTLALSLDWSSGKNSSDSPYLTVSDSKGKINLLQLNEDKLTLIQRFLAHGFEAWITAFDYWNSHVVYTGGDDCKFRKFDLRCDPATPMLTSKVHNAGVTSLHSSAFSEHLLASGSYDETINIWDTRKMSCPQSSIDVGGGVWRLKWEPHGRNLLLAACMHNGFHIIENAPDDATMAASFMDHESLAYGADWWTGNEGNHHIVASASFYDHLLCLWEFST